MEEERKDVEGYEEIYEITRSGRIISIKPVKRAIETVMRTDTLTSTYIRTATASSLKRSNYGNTPPSRKRVKRSIKDANNTRTCFLNFQHQVNPGPRAEIHNVFTK